MLTFFPSSYHDELLYSILARYHKLSGNSNVRTTIQDLYNRDKVIAEAFFPCNLAALINNMPKSWSLSIDKLIYLHTIFPLYKPFWDENRVQTVYRLMQKSSVRAVYLAAGIFSSRIPLNKYLKFCPDCFNKDIEIYKEPYWHRIHQIPSILVCPYHKTALQNSTVKASCTNSQFYYAANKENCIFNISSTPQYSADILNKLVALAEDAKFIIESNKNYGFITNERYKNILRKQGLVTRKGRVDQSAFLKSFISYYGKDFLETLGLAPNIQDPHNWISMLVRAYKSLPHPIEHMLLMRYLSGSVRNFIENICDKKPLAEGSYPCLNAAADHYLKLVVTKVTHQYSRNGNKYAIFTCSCGFVYIRNDENKNIYTYDNIKSYGPVWENKFRELIEDKGLHLRRVAKILKIDLKTVRKHVALLDLNTPWMAIEAKRKMCKPQLLQHQEKTLDTDKRNSYRHKWLTLIAQNKGITRSQIKNVDTATYNWLYYHDKEWLLANSPQTKCSKSYPRVDWMKRDIQICESVKQVIERLKNSSDKPVRITVSKVGKELEISYLLRNHLSKLPMTKNYLVTECESIEQYRIRKIKWAIKKLAYNKETIKVWKVKQVAGLLGINSDELDQIISDLIVRYRVNIGYY